MGLCIASGDGVSNKYRSDFSVSTSNDLAQESTLLSVLINLGFDKVALKFFCTYT